MASGIRRFDAIVVAGGRGSRLGGVDKPALPIAGTTLLALAIEAVGAARRVSVVRAVDDVPVGRRVSRTVERPRWAGPAAAVAAGLADLQRPRRTGRAPALVIVIAADLPRAREAVRELTAVAMPRHVDALMASDPDGRDQPLLAVYRTEALRAAVGARDVTGLGMSRLVGGLRTLRVPLAARLCADIDEARDAEAAGLALEVSHAR